MTTGMTTDCPNCGTTCAVPAAHLADDSRRIAELESQVRILTDKATAAVDKLADYEDELRQLKTTQSSYASNSLASTSDSALPSNGAKTVQNRFSNLLGGRRTSPSPSDHARRESDLQAALVREQDLRQEAEGKLVQMNSEVEDLSAQLFQQANEMVAQERKARAKLEDRVEILERRDHDKRKRLERLESAIKRIERIHNVLKT
ncbi:hypothetical protein K402DRAFT_418116 [Aulographum hederae CBS 113979]|uniref:GDP/GTP exchange factor Sec2 N-terminal domain-containing protein n=1 Tax=Aulographum hederae CBS 113979 TaxID=1176131 RepID=A0A6G1HAP1_9PEZI|nr:hypothetical protein K402DRAFT_418116 [Aulographum hederae CBS 113979]